jgi:hypothetical protein
MPDNPEIAFRVVYFEDTIKATRALADKASELGI